MELILNYKNGFFFYFIGNSVMVAAASKNYRGQTAAKGVLCASGREVLYEVFDRS